MPDAFAMKPLKVLWLTVCCALLSVSRLDETRQTPVIAVYVKKKYLTCFKGYLFILLEFRLLKAIQKSIFDWQLKSQLTVLLNKMRFWIWLTWNVRRMQIWTLQNSCFLAASCNQKELKGEQLIASDKKILSLKEHEVYTIIIFKTYMHELFGN